MSDDEAAENENLMNGNVMFSTPVSSLKIPRNKFLKAKSTRFKLPSSAERQRKILNTTDCTIAMRCVSLFCFQFTQRRIYVNRNNV